MTDTRPTFQLLHGDALVLMAGMPTPTPATLPERRIGAVITDPPYSSGGMFRGDRTKLTRDKYVIEDGQEVLPDFAGDVRDQRGFLFWCSLWLAEAWRLADEGALLAVFADWRQVPTMTDAVQAGGWVYKGFIPWNKTMATRPQKGWFRNQCEYIVLGSKGKPALLDCVNAATSDAPCLEGFFCCPVPKDKQHQTEKPREVVDWLLQVVRPGCTVLDPFVGSGTTGDAALRSGRSFLGFELTEEYHRRATERLAAVQAQGTLLLEPVRRGRQASLGLDPEPDPDPEGLVLEGTT